MRRILGARRRGSVGIVLAVAALVSACGTAPSSPPVSQPVPAQTSPSDTRVVAMGLAAPWSIAFLGTTALVSERDTGRILELDDDGHAREVGRVPDVDGTGEGGLLGIAVRGRQLYAYFTAGTENRIAAFPLTGAPGRLSLGKARLVLGGIPASVNHNGGRIAFGPDGMLYATTGDAGRPRSAQDVASLGGKILRMTPAGQTPPDNPFPGSLVYSYGHRNPQGLAWAPDGRLFSTEFGANTADELNLIRPGRNYGWPEVEGVGGRAEFEDPLQTWAPDAASPSGMAIVDGLIVIANLRGERIAAVPLADTSVSTDHHAGEFGRLRDVVVAADGSVWVLTNNTDGRGSPGAGDDRIIRVVLTSR